MQAAMMQALMSMGNTGGVGMRGKFSGETAGGDAFLALLEGLIGDEIIDMGSLFADMPIGALDTEADSTPMLFAPMQNLRRRTDSDATDEAMQMLAELMQAMERSPLDPTAQAIVELPPVLAAVPPLTDGRTQTDRAPAFESMDREAFRSETPAVRAFDRVLSEMTVTANPDRPIPLEQMEFAHAVRAAKALAAANPPEEDEPEPIDIEALQADVSRGTFAVDRTPAPAQFREPLAGDVAKQLGAGILENLGKQEAFVVKLSPEGLGEITVKMVEKEGKLLLSIATTSETVTKAIQHEVAVLQSALKPLEAEVHEIVTLPDGAAAGQFHFDQQFAGDRQFGNGYTRETPEYYVERTPDTVEAVADSRLDDGALSVYI